MDAELLESLREALPEKMELTPETVSAAYARISRSPRTVGELRASARLEVEKARRSNRAIVFDMGHSSVAEHAVFNLDITGISRLVVEEVERFRLCSYMEKSSAMSCSGTTLSDPRKSSGQDCWSLTWTRSAPSRSSTLNYTKRSAHSSLSAMPTWPRKGKTGPSWRGGQGGRPVRHRPGHGDTARPDRQCPEPGAHDPAPRRLSPGGGGRLQPTHPGSRPTGRPFPDPLHRSTEYDRLTREELRRQGDILADQKAGEGRRRSRMREVSLVHATPEADTQTVAALLFASTAGPWPVVPRKRNRWGRTAGRNGSARPLPHAVP